MRVAEVLLTPLALAERVVPGLTTPSGHTEIAVTSALVGAAVVAIWAVAHRIRRAGAGGRGAF